MANETYHYRVFALNQHGISVVSDVVSGTTAASWVPERPTDLEAEVGGSGPIADTDSDLEIELTWDEPVDPDGAPVKSYEVQYSVDGSVWDPVPEVKKSGDKHTMLTEDLDTLEAGVGYQYRVRAKNSVGNSGWSSTAKAETAPGAIPGQPDTSDFTPGVAPVELNTWLFWEPPTDPHGDAITGYEVVGRPIRVAGPRLFGGPPATLASLQAVTNGDDPEADGVDPDDERGFITVEGIHFPTGAEIDLGTATSFDEVATAVATAITANATLTGRPEWADDTAYSHPTTAMRSEDHDGDSETPNVPVYYSTRKAVPVTADTEGTDGDGNAVPDTTPNPSYWTKVGPAPALNFASATVTYTGLRFVLYIPRADDEDDLAKALKTPGGSMAKLLGWTGGSGFRSDPEFKCCPVPSVAEDTTTTPTTPAIPAMPGWKVVKTDLDRPNATDINQFLVTTKDISNTGYSSQWKANIDWQFRVRALNRRAPADATAAGVEVEGATAAQNNLEASWSGIINARPGSDSAVDRPEDLTIKRSQDDHQGRTGLILTWDKATTDPDSDDDSVNAAAYRVEYSDTGLEEGGYDWKVLTEIEVPDDVEENQQMFTDKAGQTLSASDTLAAGQTRHYRVFALVNLDANAINPTEAEENAATPTELGIDSVTVTLNSEMSWPSTQEFGGTANPLKPEAPQRLRVTERGHTHIDLAWTAPDASDDDLDGSEEGPSVITHYILETSDDSGSTWTQRMDYNDETGKEIKVTGSSYTDTQLMPGQTRDYRIRAVNSSNMSIWSNTVDATTLEAVLPNEPGGLAAETGDTPGSIKLCWNTQAEQPEDAPVSEYLIEYSADGKTGWKELARVTDYTHDKQTVMKKGEEVEIEVNKQTHTVYTDTTLDPEETRYYRVFAINLRGQSDQSDVASASASDASLVVDTTLKAPTDVTTTSTVAREMIFKWEGGENADYYILVAVDIAAYNAGTLRYETASVPGDADPKEGKVSNLNSGTQYLGIVFSVKGADDDLELEPAVATAPTTAE